MAPKVSVIVVSYNTRELTRECLEAVFTDGYRGELEVFVVDNASRDGSAAMVAERFAEVRLIENDDNVGFARANNQALAVATGEQLFLLNSDAIVRPGCIEALVGCLEREPEVGLVGPALFNADGTRQPSWGDFPTPLQEALFQSYLFKAVPVAFPLGREVHPLLRGRYARAHRVDWLTGAALMLRSEVYTRVGGLPEHSFMYGEDLELCALAAEAGFMSHYEPRAEAVHLLGASSRKDHARWIDHYTEANLGYYARFAPAVKRRAAVAVLAGSAYRSAIWSGLGLVSEKRRAEAAGRRRGYARAIGHAWRALRG